MSRKNGDLADPCISDWHIALLECSHEYAREELFEHREWDDAARRHTEALLGSSSREHTCATRLLVFVDKHLSAIHAMREFTEQQEYRKLTEALHKAHLEERLPKMTNDGQLWSERHAIAEALLV